MHINFTFIVTGIILLVILLVFSIHFHHNLKLSLHKKNNLNSIFLAIAISSLLSIGLVRMLYSASIDFYNEGIKYPLSFIICGATFLFLLCLGHINNNSKNNHKFNNFLTTSSFIVLSIYNLFEGIALGLNNDLLLNIFLLFTIVVHEWSSGVSLNINIKSSKLNYITVLFLYITYIAFLLVGFILGNYLDDLYTHPLSDPIFKSISSGIFIYFGTLNGFEEALIFKEQFYKKKHLFIMISVFIIISIISTYKNIIYF